MTGVTGNWQLATGNSKGLVGDHPRVLIIGAGVIGCASAYYLTKAGCRVEVVERGELGREASWASAGMVSQAMPADDPLGRFHALGSRMFPELAAEVTDLTGVDASYRMNGGFRLYANEESWSGWDSLYRRHRERGLNCEILTPEEVVERDPALSPEIAGGVFLPEDGVVDPRQYTRVLALAAMKLGARFRFGNPVTGFVREGDRVTGVQISEEEITGDVTVIAAGAWSERVGSLLGVDIPMQPARGQILKLRATPPLLRHTAHCGDFYITARPDGTLLLGSTVEFVGFEKRVTPAGVKHLLDQALRVAPGLADVPLVDSWAGFRPYPERELPYLGWAPGAEGVFVASGHFRTGISPSPITGQLVMEAVTGQPTTLPLEPFGF
jgi:glycine oxidase